MKWKHETVVESWEPGTNYTVGIDTDGDIGIIDADGYSIILSPEGAEKLMLWLSENLGKAF